MKQSTFEKRVQKEYDRLLRLYQSCNETDADYAEEKVRIKAKERLDVYIAADELSSRLECNDRILQAKFEQTHNDYLLSC